MRLLWSKTEDIWVVDCEDGFTPELRVHEIALIDSAGSEIGILSIETVPVPGTLSQVKAPVITLHSTESMKIVSV